jgi:hypothetical protein
MKRRRWVPTILLALSAAEPSDDAWLAGPVDLVSSDPTPDPKLPAWVDLPDGRVVYMSRLLAVTAQRMASLYAPPKSHSCSKKPIPIV